MFPLAAPGRSVWIVLVLLSPTFADDPPKPDSPLVRLLKKAPPDRQAPIVSRLGQIGSPADLDYLLDQATRPDGFTPQIRLKALEALTDAAVTRKVKPEGYLASLDRLLLKGKADLPSRLAAIRLAGLWKV